MKTYKSLIASAAIAMVLGLVVSAQAQSVQLPGELPGELTVHDPDLQSRAAQPVLTSGTKSLREGAVNLALHTQVAQLTRATEQALSSISIQKLASTTTRAEAKAVVKTDAAASLVDDHNVNVKIAFEARPIGGILTVQVSMTPSFRGVGVSTRPVVSRSVAQAVDEMDERIVREMVTELTKEIHEDFAEYGSAR